MTHEQDAQTLRQKSILTQYQIEKEALIKVYMEKFHNLPVKWEQWEDEVYRVPSEQESLLLEELNSLLRMLRNKLGIEELLTGQQ